MHSSENSQKIFILDDEFLNISLLKKILSIKNFHFFTFTSPKEGLVFLGESKVDLILLDLVMPEESGLEVLKKIRSLEINQNTPVIFISANREEIYISESFRLGAVDYINKPFQSGEVIARIENQLKIYELEKERILYLTEIETQKKVLEDSNNKIKKLLDKMNFEIDVAAKTQKFLIPIDYSKENVLSINCFYRPYTRVGGDSLFFIPREDYIDIFFGDISGHGLSAALMSGMVYLAFKMASESELNPAETLHNMHQLLSSVIKHRHLSGIFVRFLYREKELHYSYAGHPPIMRITSTNKIQELDGDGTFLILIDEPIFQNYSQKVEKGDRILFYSDGVIENFNHEEEILGMDKFKNIVKYNLQERGKNFLNKISEDVLHFSNQTPADDMTMLLLTID